MDWILQKYSRMQLLAFYFMTLNDNSSVKQKKICRYTILRKLDVKVKESVMKSLFAK